MARAIDSQNHTPADELRRFIDEAEQALGKLNRRDSASARAVLQGLDRVAQLLPGVEARGVDLRPEYTRLETLHAGVRRKKAIIVRALRSEGGIKDLRAVVQPEEEDWWWFLDEDLQEMHRKSTRRSLMVAFIVIVVGAALTILYNRYLRPDPAVVKAYELLLKGESLAAEGDFALALERIEEARSYRPDDPDLIVWSGVLRQQLDDSAAVDGLWLRATDLLGGEANFLVARGQTYMGVSKPEDAALDAVAALELAPGMSEAFLLLGSSYEAQGLRAEAIASYQQASQLADDSGEAQLSAFARMRMAMLLQQIP